MFIRNRYLPPLAALASISLVAGCGVFSSDASGDEAPLVVGTTSAPATLDPAASWDNSWELFRNVYQTLLNYSPGAAEPEPDAAESCRFTDDSSRVYSCTLRKDLKFSDGHTLDAKAVKHSFDRIKEINVNGGPAGLLGTLSRVQVKGDREVVFHLSQPDATFPLVLTTPAMSIVDPEEYPADALRKDGKISGSGPYSLASFEEGKKAELVRNDNYHGIADRKNSAVTIRYFQQSDEMVKALKDKQIAVIYRGLGASDTVDLDVNQKAEKLQLVANPTTEISYLVFNPSDPWAAKPAVRKAVAQVIDRPALAHNVYKDTVEPLYSMVPRGLVGHTTSFFDDYGSPSVSKAEQILTEAGITERVPLTLWYTSDRYGSTTKPAFEELKRQLEASDLFKVTLKSRPWKNYVEGVPEGRVPGVRARLVPRLQRRRQLHRALRGRAERARYPVRGTRDHRQAAAGVACGERPRGRGQADRGGPADPRGRRAAAAAVAGQAVRGRERGDRRSGEGHRPGDDDGHVGAVLEDQLVAGPVVRCAGPAVSGRL
ncbi:peptide/nickel transport system substrate-binding protein [Streptomyces sp. V4I2]|nr:peptide/nickel transport system substrate-binding protein [Streptomyces sp. V4I2]